MATIIDVSADCGSKARALFDAGVRTVIRYYSRDTIRPSKRLSLAEVTQIAAAGLRIGIVHEGRHGDVAANFDRDCGFSDGQYAATYALDTIGQPAGTTIYFGMDFDASAAEIRDRLIPYLRGVADGMAIAGGSGFEIGAYGSGRTCRAALDAGLVKHAWLAQSTGWGGYQSFLASGDWSLSQGMATSIAGVSCDPNVAGDGKSIGDFALAATPPPILQPGPKMFVNARNGLRLRDGPGVQFEARPALLPYGTAINPLKTIDGWTQIDLEGDGKADGFVSAGFLISKLPTTTPSPPNVATAATPHTQDVIHVAELIRQGSSAQGLKQARETAAHALPGYPHNGCAAHLSALLQQSGIDVAMTFGAGKLAHLLGERGWTRIACGKQMSGDVGVCFDNDPTPAGADHIYLVISTDGADAMMIADNQRTEDAPHSRFASGHGRTPTEYFLRAV